MVQPSLRHVHVRLSDPARDGLDAACADLSVSRSSLVEAIGQILGPCLAQEESLAGLARQVEADRRARPRPTTSTD